MEKIKTQDKEKDQQGPRPSADDTRHVPDQEGGPVGAMVQRTVETETAAGAPAPTADAPGPARAAAVVANPDSGAGATGRARLTGAMQSAVGNTRLGEMLEENTAAQSTIPLLQRKGKNPLPITLPLPKEAVRTPKGQADFKAGEVKVVALPDKHSKKPIIIKGKKRDAKSRISLHWVPPGAKTQGGKVISVDPVPAPTLTIQTTYGPKAGPKMKSGYGKGTTKEDIQAGKTSLGYHEGSHGEYAIQYVKDHPPPKFNGQTGMNVAEFKQAQEAYNQMMEAYRQALNEYHILMTDCVGQKAEGCKD